MGKLPVLIIGASLVFLLSLSISCTGPSTPDDRASGPLSARVSPGKALFAASTSDEPGTVTEPGADATGTQRMFIHLTLEPTPSQIEELNALGVTLYPESWIPPASNHPTGYLLADIPVDRLEEVAGKDYVVRLETAERLLEPQDEFQPQ